MDVTFWVTVAIFLSTYVLIISERLHRTVVALAGAVLMVALGIVTQDQAIQGIDFNTLGLLIGMMVIVGIAKDSGMFQYLAIRITRLAKGNPMIIFPLFMVTVGVLSAVLDNVTTSLLMVPVMFVIANNLRVNPKPFLIGTILFANLGGIATLIGDPTNILIGSAADLSFNDFLLNTAPAAVIGGLAVGGVLWLFFRRSFITNVEARDRIMQFKAKEAISDWVLLRKSLVVIILVLIGFLSHQIIHLEGATIALGGAALLLLTLNDPEHHLRNVEWTSIFFFTGLFILVTGLEQAGIIAFLSDKMINLTHGNLRTTALVILWGGATLSAVIDNIPLVATMIPLIKTIAATTGINPAPLWWALSLGGNVGGNATLIGASTNVVVSGMAEREGHKIGFGEYLKISLPVTIVVITLFSGYLYFRYLR